MEFTVQHQGMLGSRDLIEVQSQEMSETGLVGLQKAYKRFRKKEESIDPFEPIQEQFDDFYSFSREELKSIDYSPEELFDFAARSGLEGNDGVFISAAIENLDVEEVMLPGLENTDFIGYRNTKDVVIQGDVGQYLGYCMESGTIEVKGDSEVHTAEAMQGGRIKVHGEIEGARKYNETDKGKALRKTDSGWEEIGYTLGNESELHEAYNMWRRDFADKRINPDIAFEAAEGLVEGIDYGEEEIDHILSELKRFMTTSNTEKILKGHTGIFISAASNRLDSFTINNPGDVDKIGYRNSTEVRVSSNSEIASVGEKMESGVLHLDAPAEEAGVKMEGGEFIAYQPVRRAGIDMRGGELLVKDDVKSIGNEMKGGEIYWEGETANVVAHEMEGGKLIGEGNADDLGEGMIGGYVRLKGHAKSAGQGMKRGFLEVNHADFAGQDMVGGELGVHGDADMLAGSIRNGIIWAKGDVHQVARSGIDGVVYIQGDLDHLLPNMAKDCEVFIEGDIERIDQKQRDGFKTPPISNVFTWEAGEWKRACSGDSR